MIPTIAPNIRPMETMPLTRVPVSMLPSMAILAVSSSIAVLKASIILPILAKDWSLSALANALVDFITITISPRSMDTATIPCMSIPIGMMPNIATAAAIMRSEVLSFFIIFPKLLKSDCEPSVDFANITTAPTKAANTPAAFHKSFGSSPAMILAVTANSKSEIPSEDAILDTLLMSFSSTNFVMAMVRIPNATMIAPRAIPAFIRSSFGIFDST